MNPDIIVDFPKISCPYRREGEDYNAVDVVNSDESMEWVFDPRQCNLAVDKLDGTNICVHVRNGEIVAVDNRTTRKPILKVSAQTRWEGACLEGLSGAIMRGWMKEYVNADIYGELIGPIFNGNRHQTPTHLFVPFDYLKKTCAWRSWAQNKYPRDFATLSEWFKELPSLFNTRMKLPDIKAEGLVFYHVDGVRMAKLRRDMYPWYKGQRHGD